MRPARKYRSRVWSRYPAVPVATSLRGPSLTALTALTERENSAPGSSPSTGTGAKMDRLPNGQRA